MKKLFLVMLIVPALSLSAQTAKLPSAAAEIDTLMRTNAVSAAAAARFILEAANLLPEGPSGPLKGSEAETAAFNLALSKNWLKGAASDTVTLKDTAFLIMQSFGFKGGVMYSLTKSPRYAYREMIYNQLIQGSASPGMKVSGERLLHIIGKALSHSEETNEKN